METGLKRKQSAQVSYSCKKIKTDTKNLKLSTKKFELKPRNSVSCNFKSKLEPKPVSSRSFSAKCLKTSRSAADLKATNKENLVIQFPHFKARPAPIKKSPFKPKISTKKLTVPIDPVLHTDIRAQQRSNQSKPI